jgi:hypothetical protein
MLEGGRRWGDDAWRGVSGQRVGRAAAKAFLDPRTLVPLAGAAVFAIDDFDERASDWAVDHTPIFGSVEDAKDASDDMRAALRIELIATVLATPGGDDPGDWLWSKVKGGSVEGAGVLATQLATGGLKDATNRTRPDRDGDNSFPSGHTSDSFAYSTLANRNLDSISMPDPLRTTIKVTNVVVASGVGWARVEGQRHFPSDVLFGAALGHFMTAFIHDAFMNLPDEEEKVEIVAFPTEGGAGIMLSMSF